MCKEPKSYIHTQPKELWAQVTTNIQKQHCCKGKGSFLLYETLYLYVLAFQMDKKNLRKRKIIDFRSSEFTTAFFCTRDFFCKRGNDSYFVYR